MSVVKLIDDYLLEYGNQRFLEGWNGQQARIIELLEQTEDDWRCKEGCCFLGWNGDKPIDQLEYLIALIEGQKDNETVVFLTHEQSEQLAKAILEA